MIRSRYPHFLHLKNTHHPNNYGGRFGDKQYPALADQPFWYEQYYNLKDTLKEIYNNTKNLQLLTSNYETSPTVYSLKQVQRLIEINTDLIDKIDKWCNQDPYYSSERGGGWAQIRKNINKHFIMELSEHIMKIFQSKQRVEAINATLNQSFHSNLNQSFQNPNISFNNDSHLNSNPDYSFRNNSLNHSGFPLNQQFRTQEQFDHVSKRIQTLNGLLRKMNNVVVGQGELVNRIDENLVTTHGNMKKGRQQLDGRLRKQRGEGEFSLYGRINKTIMSLYIINLVLILIFLLKNTLF